jgi:hypothetical protein
MAELSIDPDYLRHLIVKVRSFMAKEDTDLPNDGSNPIDDDIPLGALQDEEGDLSREEVIEEIQGLTPRQRAELVALMWLGRGDGEPEEWNDLVAHAFERAAKCRPRTICSTTRSSPSIGSTVWSGSTLAALSATPSNRKGGPARGRPSPCNYMSSSSRAQDGR